MREEKKIVVIGLLIIISISIVSVANLYLISDSISKLSQEKQTLQNELEVKNNILRQKNIELTNLKNEINETTISLQDVINDIEKLQSGQRYYLHDPTYWEARGFLQSDWTDKKPYNDETFTCIDYAREVNNNAEKTGYRCGVVIVYFSDSNESHAIIAFNTTDRGIVFFEPQYDYEVKLQIGKNYWADCVITPSGHYFKREPGCTVASFEIYW